MIKEIRNITIERLLLAGENDLRFGIGTEGCVNKFCYDIENIINSEIAIQQKITLVTPRVSEDYVNRVIEDIQKFTTKYDVEYIVVNDYGIMSRLHNLDFENLILGRTLVRSLAYVPWNDYIVRDENEDVKTNLLMYNVVHEKKYQIWDRFGICGFELCYLPEIESAIAQLKKRNYKIFYHHDDTIASIGRTCPVARYFGEEPGKCSRKCKEVSRLEISQIWGRNGVIYNNASEETKNIYPVLFNKENVVYYKNNVEIIPDVDYVIYSN